MKYKNMSSILGIVVVLFSLNTCLCANTETNLDTPDASDVEKYLVSITRGLAFFLDVNINENGDKLSIMMLFFILKANLKHALQHGVRIEEDDRRYAEKVIEIADRLISLYGNQLSTNDDDDWKLASLMEHDIVIMKTLMFFNYNTSSDTDVDSNLDSLERRWNNSCDYLNQGIINLNHSKYNLSLQYSCVAALGKRAMHYPGSGEVHCRVAENCTEFLHKSPNFGMYLYNKIFFFGIANYVKGCSLTANDTLILRTLCAQAHAESQYLMKHNVDAQLFTLYVTFCSMAGEPQFFKRSWFEKLLSFQTEDGSFAGAIDGNHRRCALDHILKAYSEATTNDDVMHWDNEQFAASAVTALAAAVRFVLEPRRRRSIVINYTYVPHF